MSKTLINYVEFDVNPFREGLEIFQYDPINPDELNYSDIGYLVRLLRKNNIENPIFHYGKVIYSLFKISHSITKFEKLYSLQDSIVLNVNNFVMEDVRILSEFLIGTMIINKIMRDTTTIWKISESSKYSIYEINMFQEDYYIKSQKQKIAIYPGFIIKPSVIRPDRIGFFIDCQTKMFYQQNLTNKKLLKMIKNSKDKYLIDYCPNTECQQMSRSLSLCKLSSPQGGRIFIKENSTTTENTFIENNNFEEINDFENLEDNILDEEDGWQKFSYFDNVDEIRTKDQKKRINLIQYHMANNSLCPENKIGNSLNPKNKSIKVSIYNEEYDFPPERLRPRVITERMNRKERQDVMNELILPPHIRLNRITSFLDRSIEVIRFKDKMLSSLDPIYYQEEKPIGKIMGLKKYKLKLHNNISSLAPAFELNKTPPYDFDVRKKDQLKLFFIYFGKIVDDAYKSLKLFNWEYEIKEFFKFNQVHITNFKDNLSENMLNDGKIEEITQHDCVVLVHGDYIELSKTEERLINDIYKFKIPIQGLNISTFNQKLEKQEYNYFKNIQLGIYSKCGFIPWKLEKIENEDQKYIGINIKSSQTNNEKSFAFSFYSDSGILEQIKFQRTSVDEFESYFTQKLKKYIDKLENRHSKLKLYFMFLGKSLIEDRELIINTIDENVEYSLFDIYKSTPFRMFDEIGKRIKQVKIGTCYIIPTENEAYFSAIEPKSGTTQPTKLKFFPKSDKDIISEDDIQKIFDLTQCYTGYVSFRIKLPLPVYAVERTLNNLIKLDINEYESDKPFFI